MFIDEEPSVSSFRGKESFYDFYNSETGWDKKSKYMGSFKLPAKKQQPEQEQFSYLPQSEKEVKDLMSANLSLRTFDVKHMDHFLKTSEWGRTSQYFKSGLISVAQPSSKSFLEKKNKSQANEPLRLDFKSNYTMKNPIVQAANQSSELRPEKFYKTFFEFPSEAASKNKIQVGDKVQSLQSSEKQREEMRELVKSQREFQDWKNEHLLRKKRFRIVKGQFKSGILQGDDPFLENTKLYENDFKEIQREKQMLHQSPVALLKKNINRNFIANQVIEADNAYQRAQTANPVNNPREAEFRRSIPLWKSKGRVPEAEPKEKYIERLFSPPPFGSNRSKAREQAIVRNETRGRDHNFITKEYLKEK